MLRSACLLLLAALSLHAAETAVTIVSSLPRTGSAAVQTGSIVNGIRMALAEAPPGLRLTYHDWDDASPERGAWDPALEQANAARAIADPAVVAYIGAYNSGATKLVMDRLNTAGLAQISPTNTYTGLTKPGKGEQGEPEKYRPSGRVTFFRVVPADDIQGAVAARWAAGLGAVRAFVLHDREIYGKGLADTFKEQAALQRIEVVGYEGLDPRAGNYRALMTKIRQSGADLVYFGGTAQTNAGQVAKDLAANGLGKVRLMLPDGCLESSFLTAGGGAALDGRVFLTFGGVPPERLAGPGAEFVRRYRAAHQADPEAYAVYGYEAARAVVAAVARAAAAGAADRAGVLREIALTRDLDGALGRWSFDANGDTTLAVMSGNTVKDGRFAFVTLLGE